jgi:hypothetical protein
LPFAAFGIFANAAKGERKSDAPKIMGVIEHGDLDSISLLD